MTRIKTFIWTILITIASALFAWGLKPDFLKHIIDCLKNKADYSEEISILTMSLNIQPYLLTAQILGASLLFILLLLPFLKNNKPTGSIILKKAKGNVEVKLASVQECLVRAARRDADVKAAKVSFSGKGRNMKIHVNIVIWEMPDVPAKVEQLQFALENRFKELMGPLSDDIRIDVILKKIAARKDEQYIEKQLAKDNNDNPEILNLESNNQNSDGDETVEMPT